MKNQGIHNFSEGCLDSYFKVNTMNARFEKEILIIESNMPKVFVFSYQEDQLELLHKYHSRCVIYSIPQLPLSKESNFTEICYRLEEVFDPASYKNAKKRHQHLKYPFVWCEKEGITYESISVSNMPFVVKLHKAWVDHKMEDEKTYKIMFPSGRYIRCCNYALNYLLQKQSIERFGLAKKIKVFPIYHSYVFLKNEEVIACRILSSQDDTAYDLAFFCNTWKEDLSQLSNYVEMVSLKDLYEKGIKTVNCGSALNTYLKNFKQHVPSFLLKHWMYGKEKSE